MNIRMRYDPEYGNYGLWIMDGSGESRVNGEPITMRPIGQYEAALPVAKIEDIKCLQDLIDDLWYLGLRPSARADEYKAQLDSTRDHLNDMRALVFKGKREDLKQR
jgi:hypothetical protein